MNDKLTPAVQSFLSSGSKKLLIGGQWIESISGETFDTLNPATGAVLVRVAAANKEDVDRAVAAAHTAFGGSSWRKITPADRSRIIWKIADLIEERADDFAQIETLDNGKPLTVARRDDVGGTVRYFRY